MKALAEPQITTTGPLPLDTGAPSFPLAEALASRMRHALGKDLEMDYPPVQGLPELRDAIADIHRRELGLPHAAEQVLITYGAVQAVFLICSHFLAAGEEVLLPAPYWFRFPEILARTGARTRILATTAATDCKITPDQLERHLNERTRLLIWIHPNNPTGVVYSHGEMDALAAVLERHPRLLILADEAYNQLPLARPPAGSFAACESIGSWPGLTDRVFTVNSLSKNYAAAGLRIGYLAGPAAWMAPLTERLRLVTLGVCAALQRAALCLLDSRHEVLPRVRRQLRHRCDESARLVARELGVAAVKPAAGYYFWIDAGAWLGEAGGNFFPDDVALAGYLLREANVAILPGSHCGLPGYLRLTFAIPNPDFASGVSAMRRALTYLVA